jgi:rifampicin phosphotransferase
LIAPLTDPAWTPLFIPAAAVVVDVGAQVSHAVIVSRELGIPCVVSVTDATRRIPDGAMVTVDGTNGTVTIIEG